MSRLIRMDQTGHSTLAEWTAADAESGEAAVSGVRGARWVGAPARAGRRLLRRGQRGRRTRAAGRHAAARRRARDPAPPDRRRLDAVAARDVAGAWPERATVHWRRPMDEERLRTYARAWTLTT